jgi:hypothetical protein
MKQLKLYVCDAENYKVFTRKQSGKLGNQNEAAIIKEFFLHRKCRGICCLKSIKLTLLG